MGAKAFIIIIFIIAIGGIVFLAQSGLFDKLKDVNFSFPKFSNGSSSRFKLGGMPGTVPNYAGSTLAPANPPDKISQAPGTSQSPPTSSINPADIPAGFTADQISYYFKKIRIGAANGYVNPGSPNFTLSNY